MACGEAADGFSLLLCLLRPAAAEDVVVEFSHLHSRRTHERLDGAIDRAWEAALAVNARLFDGSKFRLASISREATGEPLLRLGLTGYREYLGTNRLDAAGLAELIADGRRYHGHADAYLSNALGCEAVLITSDDHAVLLRRSTAVATHGGLYNGPSGHPEPERAGLACPSFAEGLEGRTNGSTPCSALAKAEPGSENARACDELFDSIVQETVEETGIRRSHLSSPLLIGLMADACHKPDALFVLFTTLTTSQVRRTYESGTAEEGWESDALTLVHIDALLAHAASDESASHGGLRVDNWSGKMACIQLTAVTRAAIECMRRIRHHAMERTRDSDPVAPMSLAWLEELRRR
mmetsp:Transcript_12918/g.39435  ORF Transcript_12918/g.39435 Transcript_12918/m.39435 type:complete len:352 (+) Transcript_12918:183-1238(+)